MLGVKVLSTFLVVASVCWISGVEAGNTIRIKPDPNSDGKSIRIGDGSFKINAPARIVVCNAEGVYLNTSVTRSSGGSGGAKPNLEEGLGAIFGLLEGFGKVAEELDKNLNNPDSDNSDNPFNEETPLGGLFGAFAGLAKVAEGLDKGLNAAAPPDQCSSKAKRKCTRKGGRCQSSSDCNGKVVPNGCEGSCTCCAPPPCNKAEGFFKVRGSDQCFKAFSDESVYFEEAESICQNAGLVVAEPSDTIAPKLQKYLKNTYGGMFDTYWLNGRGTGDSINWQRSGDEVAESNSGLWWPEEPAEEDYTPDTCVYMTVWDHALEAHPGRPYLAGGCSWKPRTPLCERINYV